MLTNCYPHGYLGQKHGSFVDFSNTRNVTKDFAYHAPNEADLTPFASALSLAPQSSYQVDVPMLTDFNADRTSPSTAYSSYPSTTATVDPVSLMSADLPSHQNVLMKGGWWPENSRNNQGQYQNTYIMAFSHDGLAKPQKQQNQQYSDLWNSGSGSSNGWLAQTTAPITICPKALTLNVPSASLSSSGSSQGPMLSLSDSSSASSSREDTPDSGLETLSVIELPVLVSQHRQTLPDSLPRSRVVPLLPSNDFASGKTTQKRYLKSKPDNHSRQKPNLSYHSQSLVTPSASHKFDTLPAKSWAPKRIEPKPTSGVSWTDSSQISPTTQALHHRDAKDDFLVRSKLAGMSYKDIRRQGQFVEAESTLRGRFRTLTKHKAARVRKPEWTDNDVYPALEDSEQPLTCA